jgi:MFS family permease
MKNKLNLFDYLLFVLAILLGVVFIYLYPKIYPTAGIKFKLSAGEAVARATQLVSQFGYSVENYRQDVSFYLDQQQVGYLNRTVGLPRTNELMQDSIQAAYWQIRWRQTGELREINIQASSGEPINAQVKNSLFGEISVKLALNGELLAFATNLEDSTHGANLNDSLARQLAFDFLTQKLKIDVTNFHPTLPTVKKQPHRTDYIFKWQCPKTIAGENLERSVTVLGDKVGAYEFSYRIPGTPEASKKLFSEISTLLYAIIFLVYFFFIAFLVIRLLKNDNLSLKTGIFWGILVAVALAITMWLETANEESYALIFTLLIPSVLLGFVTGVLFAVGDASARQIWHEKLFTFDALRHRIIFFPQFGNMLLRGLAGGVLLTGVVTLVLLAGSHLGGFRLTRESFRLEFLATDFPLLFLVARLLIHLVNQEIVFRLITISFLRKYLKNLISIITVSALAASFFQPGVFSFTSKIVFFDLLLGLTVSGVLSILFIRYDFLTALLAAFSSQLFFEGYALIQYGHSVFYVSGFAVFILLGLLVVIALIGKLRRKHENLELEKLSPPYVARMTERERLIRELEIARQVQLGFLPKSLPQIPGLEVASLCLPAKEVGGDYYDFVRLDQNRLAIVIGDVSGKGISAAFYMTLMKGLLQAQARAEFSPRQVMISLNRLFYENVERGTFISMIYAVFDLHKQTVTLARAGHNPVIVKAGNHPGSRKLFPRGLALGLEGGLIFNQTIEELTIGFQPEDYFVFYTDGITEAMNEQWVEFGENALVSLVEQNSVASAEQLLLVVKNQVKAFVGKAPQHDDMTMVVIKIRKSAS